MKYNPHTLGKMTITFDVVQVEGDYRHDIKDVAEELVTEYINGASVILFAEDTGGKRELSEESKYDTNNVKWEAVRG